MSELDKKIIGALRHNARRSVSDLATELTVSRATVKARINRLEKNGEIVGYTVILRADSDEAAVRGIMMIEVEGHMSDKVIKILGGFSEISAIHTTNGRFDIIVELSTTNLSDFDNVLRRIRLIQGITASETHLLLATPRSTRAYL